MSLFDSVRTMVERGERLFPFNCFDEHIDWDGVSKWLDENKEKMI